MIYGYDSKGYLLFQLGKTSEAIELANKSISLDKNYANAWYNRSIYYSHENKVEASVFNLQKAITLDKKYGYDALIDRDFDKIKNNLKFITLLKEYRSLA